MTEIGDAIGRAVRDERQRLGWTQEELAARSTIARETVVSIEGGTTPTIETLQKVADGLGVAGSILLSRAERG